MITMLRSNLFDYADSYILVKGTITITGAGNNAGERQADERDKSKKLKNCASFTKCISRINNTDIDSAHDIDIVMPMYNLIEYSDNYSKSSGSFQPINSISKTYGNIRKIATGKGDDYTTGCLLDYPYFKENYKMIAIDLSRQNELDADPRAIQQINFTANLDRAGNTTIFFIIEEAKETIFEFSQGTVKVL